jgi:hypothetical protein
LIPLLAKPLVLSNDEFASLVDFVRDGLLDKKAGPEHTQKFVPSSVPSGRPTLEFEFEYNIGKN